MTRPDQRIMIVEDERIVALNISQRLKLLGYEVPAMVTSGLAALEAAERTRPDLVLMDIRIEGDFDGIEAATRLNARRNTPIVYLTAHSEDSLIERARTTRPYGYLLKPFSEREMHATLQMAFARRDVEVALESSEERLRLALDSAGAGIWEIDAGNRSVRTQGPIRALMDLPAGEPFSLDGLVELVEEADRERMREAFDEYLAQLDKFSIDFRTRNENGVRWLRAQGQTRHKPGGVHMLGILQDVTSDREEGEAVQAANAELERRVAERTAELNASIAELRSFSHSVAHDLRAPLRTIVGMGDVLRTDHADRLELGALHLLGRVVEAGKRMNRLIDGLLLVARISNAAFEIRDIDLAAEVRTIADQLQESEPDRAVHFVICPAAPARADPTMVLVLLENLLRNAWKFTSRNGAARIQFGMEKREGEIAYFVKDDGAGFDMQHAGDLFQTFKRLHSASEFDGEGIGLSTVRRIVERHEGRAWIESVKGGGTTVWFTLAAPLR